MLLQKTCNGWHSLSTVYRHPACIKIILDFINANIDKFPKEVIKEIILQKNKLGYTCLHLAARFQPDSLPVILNFIEKNLGSLDNDLKPLFKKPSIFQRFNLFQKANSQPNLLALSSKHQPESVQQLASFLTANANYFKQTKPSLFKKSIHETANNASSTQRRG